MKKVLFIATVYKFFNFERSDMTILKSKGYEIHTASNMVESDWLQDNGMLDSLEPVKHQIDFGRSPFSKQSLVAYKQLRQLLEENYFDIIHCHTPVAAAIARIAAIKTRNKGTRVIYTDHGFHFHKKSSKINWLLYYPIEFVLSYFTDMIIAINKEDYDVIQRFPTSLKRYIPGVGVDTHYISNMIVDKEFVRKRYCIPKDSFVIFSIGELSFRKNQSVVIRAMRQLKDLDVYYILCGTGVKELEYKRLAKELNVENRVIFAGFQSHEEVFSIAHASDLGVLPSLIEGLGLAGIESLSAGKPVVASGVHGINDYVIDNETGIRCNPKSPDEFAAAIRLLYVNRGLYAHCSEIALQKSKEFDVKRVKSIMESIYNEIL